MVPIHLFIFFFFAFFNVQTNLSTKHFFFNFKTFFFKIKFFIKTNKTKPKYPITVVGKRKFDGGHQNQGDPKRRYASAIVGNGGGNWGSQPLPQQPLGTNGEQWYTDTFPAWS